jgi:hypothetical protein
MERAVNCALPRRHLYGNDHFENGCDEQGDEPAMRPRMPDRGVTLFYGVSCSNYAARHNPTQPRFFLQAG